MQELPQLFNDLKTAAKPLGELQDRKAPLHMLDVAKGCEGGVAAFSWPLLDVGTVENVNNALEATEFYHNKARKTGKDANKPELVTFANTYRDLLKAMAPWVKDNAKMGITWNAKGGDWKSFGGAAAAPAPAAAPAAAAAPAPAKAAPVAAAPAPAAAPAAAPTPSSAGGAAPNLAGLFTAISSIDQSSGRTEGLKHVTKEMKAAAKADAPPAVVKAAPAAKGPKETVIAGLKLGEPGVTLNKATLRWEVNFQSRDTAAATGGIITIADVEPKHEVYIYGCRDCAIDIKGKVKGVRIDQCGNVTVLLSAALSGVEVVNSKKMKIQVREKLPSVAIDKTDGILVGLTWAARDAIITTSKSSEMNVTFPLSDKEDADWVEQPIPEQFVSKLSADGKLVTSVSELYTS